MSIDAAQEWQEARDRLNQSGDDEANHDIALDFAAYVYGHGLDDKDYVLGCRLISLDP